MPDENKNDHKGHEQDAKKLRKVPSQGSEQTLYADGSTTPQILVHKGYLIGELLGRGAFSQVFKGTYTNKKTGVTIEIAVKVINRDKVDKDWEVVRLPIELKVAKKVVHKHIIKYIGTPIKTPHRAFIFMELCMESMEKLLENYPSGFPEKHCQTWFHQLVSALCYLQRFGIAHRDLKLENLLLDKVLNVKLTDFSFAFFCFEQKAEKLAETSCGTPGYKAPEIYMDKPYDALKADIWSSGAILYEMMFNQVPFPVQEKTMNEKQIIKLLNYKRYPVDKKDLGPRESKVTEEFKTLIRALLEPDPELRITHQKLVKDKWFTLKLDADPIRVK